MIRCNKCNRPDLKIEDMVKDKSIARGHKTLCKKCKSSEKLAIPAINKEVLMPMTEALTPRQKRNWGATVYTPRVRDVNEALPWQLDKMAGLYVPEPHHQRNDGLKHLKSLGVQC